jgi:class 3 adenylate cyclase/tetratricopeptide (TPR) repeat protein
MGCSRCGEPNTGDLPSCSKCGEDLRTLCSRCAWSVAAIDRFCAHCGLRLERSESTRGERRNITVLFADLVSSTSLAQGLDPEDFHAVVREYLATCSEVIRDYGGHVAQTLGDGLLAYYGYPQAHERSTRNAVAAGLELVRAVGALRGRSTLSRDLAVRVAIHTGPVVFGDTTSADSGTRLAFGTTPNLTARLQEVAAPNTIVVSEFAFRLVEQDFVCEKLGDYALKGLEGQTAVYRVLAEGRSFSNQTPLAGREAESRFLLDCWRDVERGEGRVVLLSGEPGIGKSRQVQAFIDALEPKAHTLIDLRCSPFRDTSALYPIVDFVHRRLGVDRQTNPEEQLRRLRRIWNRRGPEEALPAVAPFLLGAIGEAIGGSAVPKQRQRQVAFEGLRSWVMGAARELPVVLVVEDLQWADPSTLEWLDLLLAGGPGSRMLALFTARSDFRPPWPHTERLTELSLRRLSRTEAKQIAIWTARHGHLSEQALDEVVEKADGIPLFVEEITKSLKDVGAAGTGEPFAGGPRGETSQIPAALQDPLMARLDRLGSGKQVAQMASALGRDVPFAQLLAISDLPEATLRAELGHLTEAEILLHRPSTQETYTFKHALIQEVAYSSLLRSAQRQYHARIAREIVSRFPETAEEQPEVIAHHFARAGEVSESIRYLSLAGQRALSRSALLEAISTFTRALQELSTLPASRDRDSQEIELRSALGLALISSKGYSAKEVEESYTRAQFLCEGFGDVPLRVLYGIWAVHFVRGDAEAMNRLVPIFARLLDGTPEVLPSLIVNTALGSHAFQAGDLRLARPYLAAATDRCDGEDPRQQNEILLARHGYDGLLYAPLWLAFCHLFEGDEERCKQVFQTTLELAERAAFPYLICMVLAFGAALAREMGDIEQARILSQRGVALSVENGFYFWQAIATCAAGWVQARNGAPDEGIAQMRGGLALLGAIGSQVNRGYFLSYLAEACLDAGRLDEGLAVVDEALALCRSTFSRNYEAELERLRGALMAARGDLEAAETHLKNAIVVARAQGAKFLEKRAVSSLEKLAPRAKRPSAALQGPEGERL